MSKTGSAGVGASDRDGEVLRRLALFACALVPTLVAAANAREIADPLHDAAALRVAGLGWTEPFRAVEGLFAAPLLLVPLGSRGLRAALASSLAAGLGGGVLFELARALLAALRRTRRLGTVLAAVASLSATLSIPWQIEATSAGGAVLTTALALAAILTVGRSSLHSTQLFVAAVTLGLVAAQEPLIGAATGAAVAAALVLRRHELPPWRALALSSLGIGAGLVPLGVAWLARGSPRALALSLEHGFGGASAERRLAALRALAEGAIGATTLALAAVGAIAVVLGVRARPVGSALLVLASATALLVARSGAVGPAQFDASALLLTAACTALAGAALQEVITRVAEAKMPLARPSAALFALLGLALPLRFSDDAFGALEAAARRPLGVWDDTAFASLPVGSALLFGDIDVAARALALRVTTGVRDDLRVLPAHALAAPVALRELRGDATLAAVFRDYALYGRPQEWSLSALAAARPLFVDVLPFPDRTLARHVVPKGLWLAFESEARGASDRRAAMDAFATSRDRLARALLAPPDQELLAHTREILQQRAFALAIAQERELLPRALDDVRAFLPDDPLASALAAPPRPTPSASAATSARPR